MTISASSESDIDKVEFCSLISNQLETALQLALTAADQAHATATDKENIAENKYDTLGLEAAYLAHGQSERVVQLKQAIQDFNQLRQTIAPSRLVGVGALVALQDDDRFSSHLFVGPSAGGETITYCTLNITVITPTSPLGRQLLARSVDDEITTEIAGQQTHYLITNLW